MHNPDRYVGFVPRVACWSLDKLLFLALTSLLAWLYPVPGLSWRALWHCGLDLECIRPQAGPLAMAALQWLLPALAAVWFLTRMRATPGKLLLRAQVVDAISGATPSVKQAWLRVLGSGLSYLTLGAGHLLVLVDPRKQALHDKIAGTVVIRVRPGPRRNLVRWQFRTPAQRDAPHRLDPRPPRRARTNRPAGPGPA